ncbi:hypothetical protein [Haloferula sp.]|uniref:hypothetical protein n=1 Tax=Haloferula sp. TaxID=2497595 RepID=UPI00329EF358
MPNKPKMATPHSALVDFPFWWLESGNEERSGVVRDGAAISLTFGKEMTEEEAVFTLGKRFSFLRNHGEELPVEKVKVGRSLVPPSDLADEYDKHFPPGPPQPKRLTEREFEYELVYLGEIRMGLPVSGLNIRHSNQEWDVLRTFNVFWAAGPKTLEARIETTKCNRFDVITGRDFTFVVDKIDEALSVLRARYRVDNTTFCDETPILGPVQQYLESTEKLLGTSHFPFVPFSMFWDSWNSYVKRRTGQINELRNAEQGGDGDA